MATGSTASSYQTVIGVAAEPQPATGTPVATSAAYVPVRKMVPKNIIAKLPDNSWRGSMVESVGVVNGTQSASLSIEGDAFADTLPWYLAGILGDVTYTGGTNAGSSTTSATSMVAGTTTTFTVVSGTGLTIGTVLAIGTGANLELGVCITGTTGTTVVLSQPVQQNHTGTTTIQPVTAPFQSNIALYNGGNGQPVSQTWLDSDPLSTRQYASTRFTDFTLTFDASKLVTYSATALAWATQSTTSAPSAPSYASFGPAPAWECQATYGGSSNATVQSAELSFKRSGSECIFTLQNTQNPYEVHVGPIAAVGVKMVIVASTELFLTDYLAGNQKVLSLNLQQGTGAGAQQVKFQMSKLDINSVEKDKGKSYIAYQVDAMAYGNTTDIGLTAGYSPCLVTVQNAVAPRQYAN